MRKLFLFIIFVLSVLGFNGSSFAADCDDLPVLNEQLQLHIPYAQLPSGVRVWADFEFVPTSNDLLLFRLTDFGQIDRDFACAAEDVVTVDNDVRISIPHLLFRDRDDPRRNAAFWAYLGPLGPDDPVPPPPDNGDDLTVKVTEFGPKIVYPPNQCQYRGEVEVTYRTTRPVDIHATTRLPFCVAPSGSVAIGGGSMSYDAKKDLGEVVMYRKGEIRINPRAWLDNVAGTGGVSVSGLAVDLHGSVQEHIDIKTHSGVVLASEDPSSEWEYGIMAFPLVRDWLLQVDSQGGIENHAIVPGGILLEPLIDYVRGVLRLYP